MYVAASGGAQEEADLEILQIFAEFCVSAYMRIFPEGFISEKGNIHVNSIPAREIVRNEELA